MKRLKHSCFLLTSLVLFILFQSCSKDADEVFDTGSAQLEENGLTKSINDLVPDSILQNIIDLDMPINKGDNPPLLEGKYFSSPLSLVTSNIPNDYFGQPFLDITWNFYDQDFSNLSINVDYESSQDKSIGRGSYIVGDGGSFTVFVDALGEYQNGDTAQFVYVISGRLENENIHDFHLALFMVDNHGNPNGVWISNGQGRIIIDSDQISEKI